MAPKIILTVATKGGVGKSLISINMAYSLLSLGRKTGLLDIDISMPALVKYLKIEGRDLETRNRWIEPLIIDGLEVMSPGLMMDKDQPVLIDGAYRTKIVQQCIDTVEWKCDYLIIDTPPGSNDEIQYILSERRDLVLGAVVVTTPSEIAISQIRRSIFYLKRTKIPILGIVSNMVGMECLNCHHFNNLFNNGYNPVHALSKEFDLKVIAEIPVYSKIDEEPLHFVKLIKEGLANVKQI